MMLGGASTMFNGLWCSIGDFMRFILPLIGLLLVTVRLLFVGGGGKGGR